MVSEKKSEDFSKLEIENVITDSIHFKITGIHNKELVGLKMAIEAHQDYSLEIRKKRITILHGPYSWHDKNEGNVLTWRENSTQKEHSVRTIQTLTGIVVH